MGIRHWQKPPNRQMHCLQSSFVNRQSSTVSTARPSPPRRRRRRSVCTWPWPRIHSTYWFASSAPGHLPSHRTNLTSFSSLSLVSSLRSRGHTMTESSTVLSLTDRSVQRQPRPIWDVVCQSATDNFVCLVAIFHTAPLTQSSIYQCYYLNVLHCHYGLRKRKHYYQLPNIEC